MSDGLCFAPSQPNSNAFKLYWMATSINGIMYTHIGWCLWGANGDYRSWKCWNICQFRLPPTFHNKTHIKLLYMQMKRNGSCLAYPIPSVTFLHGWWLKMVEGYDDRWGSPLQGQNSLKVGHKRCEMLGSLTVASFTLKASSHDTNTYKTNLHGYWQDYGSTLHLPVPFLLLRT